jgi:hypothetical protein
VFRGRTAGNLRGPYVSQFLWKDIQRGMRRQDQRLRVAAPGLDYLTDYDTFLAVQNGATSVDGQSFRERESYADDRYIVTGRDLATYVHRNTPQQPYLAAALILQDIGAPLDENIREATPDVQFPFVDYGNQDFQAAVTGINQPLQHAAWYFKWLVHRRLRPEEYGGRVYNHLQGDAEYPIPDSLLSSEAVARTRERFGTALLPQAYPEGSPTHPSFPAGHAVQAGAMATVVKAYFDGSYEFAPEEKVVPTPDGSRLETARETSRGGVDDTLTVAGELNKLVGNMTLGRDWAGIHYRTDAIDGIRAGERVAYRYLQDRLRTKAPDGSLSFRPFGPTAAGGGRSTTGFDGEDEVVIEP